MNWTGKVKALWGMVLAFPAFGFLCLFKVVPIVVACLASFSDYPTTRGFKGFVGVDNYRYLFADPIFMSSLKVTLFFVTSLTLAQIVLAFLLAVILQEKCRANVAYRLIFFLPYAVSLSIASIIWWMIYAEWGLANGILAALKLPRQPFLSSVGWAPWAIVLMLVWKGVGYWTMVFIAGLNNIPVSLYEASTVDGANALQRFFYITIPLLKRVIAFVAVSDTTINFLTFAPVYVMTNGGPRNATNLLAFYAYRSAFTYNDMGYASAISVVLVLLTAVVVGAEFRLLRTTVTY
ncbi:MAG: sugar ABC transporter permease [Candidatus Methanomethyliaceae archaeon]